MDATSRADLRELNELNFARFEAKLDQRVAELEARLVARFTSEVALLDARIQQQKVAIEALERRLETRLGEHLRWQFVTWAALFVPIIGLWFR